MEATGSLRERKKAQTRQQLAQSAMRLFRERGFDETTVDQIAAEASVGRRTFFRYFSTKEAAVFPRYEERLQAFQTLVQAADAGASPLSRVREAFLALAREYDRDRAELSLQQQVIDQNPPLLAYERALDLEWEKVIAQALGDGDPTLSSRQQRSARVMAGAVMGVVRATLREWFAGGNTTKVEQMAEEALDLLENGLSHGSTA